MHTLTVVIPTYDEAENIAALLPLVADAAARNPDVAFTALVVDDSSPDGTADVARRMSEELAERGLKVHVMTRTDKSGLGAAYIAAFLTLLADDARPDLVLQMDADLSHDPAYIDAFLVEARAGADLVVGSRYLPGGATPDWSFRRRLLSSGGNLYTRMLLGSRITDYTGGFNLYRSDLLARLDVPTVTTTGYGFQILLKHRALRTAERVRQVPIVFLDRTRGVSKLPSDTLVKHLWLVLRLRLGRDGRGPGAS